jgi:hypothetical protein
LVLTVMVVGMGDCIASIRLGYSGVIFLVGVVGKTCNFLVARIAQGSSEMQVVRTRQYGCGLSVIV